MAAQPIKVGFALCGSFCTFDAVIAEMEKLVGAGYEVTPIMSFNAFSLDTKFGRAADINARIEKICGRPIIRTIPDAEPIGPTRMFDVLLVAPCTGNTLAKLACGITDTPVTMAVKSHLRNRRPVVLAIATNDALSASAKNIGELLNRRGYSFVPFAQDAPEGKPTSALSDFTEIKKTLEAALEGRQITPVIK